MDVVANLTLAPSKPKQMIDAALVGKDVLELLTGAMYADPLTIFREYVQNAADSIDMAREAGLRAPEGFGVVVSVDRAQRSIRLRDNGLSIPQGEFVNRLTAIGASSKRGKGLRGFRGVGRLSGLGYCQELLFRGRAEGDAGVTELRWDGRKLRTLLRDAAYEGELGELIRDAVEIRNLSPEGHPERFFEVELRKVVRLRGDLLLNDDAIRLYLAQSAPVPFSPDFNHGERIQAFLRKQGVRDPIDVRIDGDAVQLYHPACNAVAFSPRVSDPFHGVELLEFRDEDGNVAAFGWCLEHNYLGAIPKTLGLGGLRLRAGNIQVGNELIMAPLLQESRFAGWMVGEIHVTSPKITPNARRDDFESGVAYAHLQDELSIFLKRITQGIRDRSISRNRVRKAQDSLGIAEAWLDQARDEDLPVALAIKLRGLVETHLAGAQKHAEKLGNGTPEALAIKQRISTALARRTRLLRDDVKPSGRTSARDKAVEVAIGVILEHAATPLAGLTMCKRVLKAFEA